MQLLGDVGHLDSHFFLFGDSVSVDARQVHGLREMYHRLRKSFSMHSKVPLGDEAQVEA